MSTDTQQAIAKVIPTSATPLDMSLNEGTWCPESCLAVFRDFAQSDASRRYSTSDNWPLKELTPRSTE
ncbi:MAG: hypothetical protein H7338_11320 [Candidatus Sericytochromatia bacterium]|nr:hypothetical protein [Candidatus Sericytochromatia bacterium]